MSLQQQAVDTFYAQSDTPRWMGLRLVGVDPDKDRMPRYFGRCGAAIGTVGPTYR